MQSYYAPLQPDCDSDETVRAREREYQRLLADIPEAVEVLTEDRIDGEPPVLEQLVHRLRAGTLGGPVADLLRTALRRRADWYVDERQRPLFITEDD